METHADNQSNRNCTAMILDHLTRWAIRGRCHRVLSILIRRGTNLTSPRTGCTYLIEAVLSGQTQSVTTLIKAGADIDAQGYDRASALAVASRSGYNDIVNILLNKGAQTETRDNDGRTPLWFAALNGQTDVVRMLVSAGANVNTQDNTGFSALSAASHKGHTDVVNVLLEYGAQIEARDNDGRTPLWLAALKGQTDVVRTLVSAGADVNTQRNDDGISALGFASQKGHIDVVQILLHNRAKVETRDDYGRTPLWLAALMRRTDVVRALVSAGADVNAQRDDGFSALGIASEKGYIDVVDVMLDSGAQIETTAKDGRTPLWFAAGNGQTDVVRTLVSAGADVNTQGNDGVSALDFASQEGHIDVVNVLLASGAQIQTRDNDGHTPLWFAAGNGQTDVVRALVSAGADVNTQRNDGSSALDFASQEGLIDVVNVLLASGAQIETRDNVGRTPLWLAALKGRSDVVRTLVSARAEVNTQSNDGSSALGIASQEGHIDVVNVLLDNGAKVETRDNDGRTPLWFAAANGQTDVVRALVSAGADVSAQRNDSFSALAACCESKVLLDNNTQVDFRNNDDCASVVLPAKSRNKVLDVRTFVCADTNFRSFGNLQPLDAASYLGNMEIVKLLLCSYPRSPAMTPVASNSTSKLHADCSCCSLHLTTYLQVMESLLENGADVEPENVDGLRLIHWAVRTRLVKLVQLLIDHGANVDASDIFGNRPLHEAVSHGLDVVQLLVRHGAKVNVRNNDGKSPLHIAVERQHCDVIMFLLNEDADVGLTDVWRNTPLHYVTSELLAVSGVADQVIKLLTKKHRHMLVNPNVVGVYVLSHIMAHGISDYQLRKVNSVGAHDENSSVNFAAVGCNQRTLFGKPTYLDCQGNTPLHHAVGVYGHLKMFKISNDVAKIIEFLVRYGVDINAQNKDGLTALHVARGHEALNSCLQYTDDQSFALTDKRGRNFWHLLFITKVQHVSELAANIRPMIAVSDAKYSVDDLNRTPLHYCCMNRNTWISMRSWLAKEFIEEYNGEYINKQDSFGRTALHYAVIGGSTVLQSMLEAKQADERIQDKNQKTSRDYKTIQTVFDRQVSVLRLIRSSSFIAKNFCIMSLCVQKCLVKYNSAEMRTIARELTGFTNAASYVLNTWNGCRYDYSNSTDKKVDQQVQTQEELAGNNDESFAQQTNMFAAIQTHVDEAMHVLAQEITALDRLFACEITSVGSAHEGTKIGCCDEFDYDFVLTNLSSVCEVCYSPESPPGFVLLKASASEYDKELDDLFDHSGILNTRTVKFKFEILAKHVLSSKIFFDLTDMEFVDDLKIQLGNMSTQLNTRIEVTFTKPISKCHVLHSISVDLVPALQIDDWWLDDARQKELCQAGDCLIVFAQPQNKYPWIGWTEPHGFISFAKAESRLLRECPLVVKTAYMVVKRMSEYFCQYKLFPSHSIKTALLWCLEEKDFTKYRSSCCSEEVDGDELLRLVQNIVRRLLCFAAQDYVPSYFLPKCHQPVWLSEKYLKRYTSSPTQTNIQGSVQHERATIAR